MVLNRNQLLHLIIWYKFIQQGSLFSPTDTFFPHLVSQNVYALALNLHNCFLGQKGKQTTNCSNKISPYYKLILNENLLSEFLRTGTKILI